ncbi:hypothetical protein V8E51_000741 [Hyaloscypha variabilis]
MSSSDLPLNGECLAFTNFAKLPPELLFMVWKEAAHVPQLISLEYEAARDNFKGNHIRCPLLLVNKEARREVLRYKKDLDAEYLFQLNLEEIILLVSVEIDDSRLKLVAAQERDAFTRRKNEAQAMLERFNKAKIIRKSGPRDLSDWKVPKVTVLNFKNFTPTSC